MKKPGLVVTLVLLLALPIVRSAGALAPFKKAFQECYADKSKNEDFQKLVRKTGCNVCHVKGESKEIRNQYGAQLAKLIEGRAKERMDEAKKNDNEDEEKAKLLEELKAAFASVEKVKTTDGDTYGDRLKALKLPVEVKSDESGDDEGE